MREQREPSEKTQCKWDKGPTKECEFYKKAKDIENMRQNGKITFNETKKYYSRLNSGKLSIKITENRNVEMMCPI